MGNVDASIVRYGEVVVMVWFVGVICVCTNPEPIGIHSLNSEVTVLDVLVNVSIWGVLGYTVRVYIKVIEVGHVQEMGIF